MSSRSTAPSDTFTSFAIRLANRVDTASSSLSESVT